MEFTYAEHLELSERDLLHRIKYSPKQITCISSKTTTLYISKRTLWEDDKPFNEIPVLKQISQMIQRLDS